MNHKHGGGNNELTDHLTFYSAQRLDLFAWCVKLSRLLVGFRTHFKSLHFLLLLGFLEYLNFFSLVINVGSGQSI